MSEIIRKAQTGEPTINGGQFGSITRPEANAAPLVDREAAANARILTLSTEAGYPGVMPGVLELIVDRGSDEGDRWLGIIESINSEDVADGYTDRIGPAVDKIHDRLSGEDPWPGKPTVEDVESHIAKICDEAGLSGVMPGVLEAVLERDEYSTYMRNSMMTRDHVDVTDMYERFVGPAIDDWCDHLSDDRCSECGHNLEAYFCGHEN